MLFVILFPAPPTDPATNRFISSSLRFFVFNVGNPLGRPFRSLPPMIIWSGHRSVLLSPFRALFVPAFLLFDVQFPLSTDVGHPLISSD